MSQPAKKAEAATVSNRLTRLGYNVNITMITRQRGVMSLEGSRAMREGQVLEALRKSGDQWVKRSELAKLLGRDRLYQLDLEALAALEAKKQIEVERKPDARPSGYVAYYRAK